MLTPSERKRLLAKDSWLRNFGLSEPQLKHLVANMRLPSVGLFVVGYVHALIEDGKLATQIEHDTIDSRLDPEPPDRLAEELSAGERAAKEAPSAAEPN